MSNSMLAVSVRPLTAEPGFKTKYQPTHGVLVPIHFIPAAYNETAMDLSAQSMSSDAIVSMDTTVPSPSTSSIDVDSAIDLSFPTAASYFRESRFEIDEEDEELYDDRNTNVSGMIDGVAIFDEKPVSDYQDIPVDNMFAVRPLTTESGYVIEYQPTRCEPNSIYFIPHSISAEGTAMDLLIPRMSNSSNTMPLPLISSTGVATASGMSFATAASYFQETQFKMELEDEKIDQERNTDDSGMVEDEPIADGKSVSVFQDVPADNFPERMQFNFKRLIEEKLKLQEKVAASNSKIHVLHGEIASNIKNIDQIVDLNIKLQIKLQSECVAECRVLEDNVSIPRKLTSLDCCEIGEKGDPAFILKLLLTLYSREDLRVMSITGKPTRNSNYGQEKSERISSQNLQYIKDKFFERVRSEQITEFESEKRCRDVNVHKMINAKIQNLKRCRLIDCQKGSYGN